MQIAIIGAGLAGLSCAKHLAAAGHEIVVFDKGRGPGGRLSGRRHELGAIDHGAQYFTVRDASFQRQVDEWLSAGIVAQWRGRFVEDRPEGLTEATAARYLGSPRMNACIRDLAAPFTVHWKTRISMLLTKDHQWVLDDTDGAQHDPFDAVVIAIPPVQAAELLTVHPTFLARVQNCSADPCWALMVWLDPAAAPPFNTMGCLVEPEP